MWREIKRPPISAQQAAFLRRLKLRRYTIYTIQILLLVGFFLLWEVAARKGWVDAFLFSQPTEIWATAVEKMCIRDRCINPRKAGNILPRFPC